MSGLTLGRGRPMLVSRRPFASGMMAALLRIWLARNGTPRLAAYSGGRLTAAGGTRKWLRSRAPRGGRQRQEFVRSKNTWLKECRQRGTNDFQVLSTKAAHDATAKRHC